jgi:hypothetical protein
VDVIPGISLHLELQRFVASGFTPLQALMTLPTHAASPESSPMGAAFHRKISRNSEQREPQTDPGNGDYIPSAS